MSLTTASRLLVTGANGFIGSHLSRQLIKRGYKVRAFVNDNSRASKGNLEDLDADFKESIDVFSGDIRDECSVKKAMRGCDVVIHLAALCGISGSYSNPSIYVETNIGGTLNILQAARELGVEKVVHTSSSEVYGTARFVPMTEDHPQQGNSPYSATKIGADQLALSFFNSFGTPVTIVRPFNTYGPGQSVSAVVPTIITQLAEGKTEISLGAIHPTRDFTYILDTVSGFIAAAEEQTCIGEVINIGSSFEVSIGDVVTFIAQIMRMNIDVLLDQERLRPEKNELCRQWADNSKAKALLGWQPKYGGREGLIRGLEETIAWFLGKSSNRPGCKAETKRMVTSQCSFQ